jgi:putative peptide zinc metalloprotease protein
MAVAAGHDCPNAACECSNAMIADLPETLGYRLRPDIQWKANLDGQALEKTWIASDPLTRRLFRCGDHEYQILQWINGSATTEQIIDRFHNQFRPRRIEPSDLKNLIERCLGAGILRSSNPRRVLGNDTSLQLFPQISSEDTDGACQPAYPRIPAGLKQSASSQTISGTTMASDFFRWLASTMSKWMQCQVPLVNPDRWLGPMARCSHWLYSKTAVVFWLMLATMSLGLLVLQCDRFFSELPSWNSLRSPGLLIGFGVLFVVTRLIHELGHAIVCKRHGVSCKEMGVLMSFGMMCPYVDITDAWKLQDRYARMSIAVAGIYNEILVASLAVLVWVGTYPGWLHTTALQVLLVCSVTTLVFNANPLMKYDGYFLLCDWLNIQNLRERSFEAFDDLLGQAGSRRSPWNSIGLIFYFFASSINRVVISVSVAGMVYALARQWQVAGLGVGLIVAYAICSMIVGLASWPRSLDGSKPLGKRATALGWIAVCLLIAWILHEPLPNRVAAHGSFVSGKRYPVYALTQGRLVDMLPSENYSNLSVGSPLVSLVNESLERTVLDLEGKLAKMEAQLTTLERVAYFQDEAGGTIPLLKAQREVIRRQLEQKSQEFQQLVISAPTAGRFEPATAPPLESPENPSDSLLGLVSYRANAGTSPWARSKSLGRHVEKGTLLGWMVQDNQSIIECRLTEEQVAGIKTGTDVRVVLTQNSSKIWQGRIAEIASTAQNTRTVTQATIPSATNSPEEKQPMQYQVRIQLNESDRLEMEARQYMSGSAEIVFLRPSMSLFELATEYCLRNFRLR